MIRTLITGGFGFIGLETIKQLRAVYPGRHIVVADRREKLDELLSHDVYDSKFVGNVMRTLSLVDDIISPDEALFDSNFSGGVLHLGACVDTMERADLLMEKNVEYTRKLLRTQRDNSFVFASSAAVYGVSDVPNNPYGLSKKISENLISKRVNTAVLRFFNVYGPYEHHKGRMTSMPHRAVRAYLTGTSYDLFNVVASRDFVHVSDVAGAIVASLVQLDKRKNDQLVYDVGTGTAVSFDDMETIVKNVFGGYNSRARSVEFPKELIGRYQMYTRAGVHARNILSNPIQLAEGVALLKEELEQR